jgi:hypothetical protein
VKIGSEVNFLVLDVLPRLRPGVVVHLHDIFLPLRVSTPLDGGFRPLLERAVPNPGLLAHNESWDVRVATQALKRMRRAEFADIVFPSHHGARRSEFGSVESAE